MRFLSLVLLVAALLGYSSGNAIDYLDSCDDSIENEIDKAKIYFDGGKHFNVLYGLNTYCYKCSKTLFVQNSTNGVSEPHCSSVYTPHTWTLSLYDINGNRLDETEYTFGEQGEYKISGSGDRIEINKTKDPVDSLKPLWILVGVFIALIIVCFGGPPLYKYLKDRYYPDRTNNLYSAAVPLMSEQNPYDDTKSKVDARNSSSAPAAAEAPKKPARLSSLDTFRGFSLCCMIFVNYGAGGYWFFDHADWNGLTFADLLFPWFMWMMGVSMAMSFASQLPKIPRPGVEDNYEGVDSNLWFHVCKRSATLFLLGMFLANGWEYTTWRVPGVLQYFGVSYFVTSCTVLGMYGYTRKRLMHLTAQDLAIEPNGNGLRSYLDFPSYPRIMTAYSYEWIIQAIVLIIYLSVAYGGKAPGCPRGYIGPGGISEDSKYFHCTGGIHRYIDMKMFGYDFIYHHPTCINIYQCIPYDPEGFLGAFSACTLTYLGLMSGRVILHFKSHTERLTRWATYSFFLLLLTGILCGFSTNDGAIPVNKNLWSTSFVTVTAGGGLVGLGICYIFVDLLKVWSGAPFLYLGMNSILIYFFHGILQNYMPFSYKIYHTNHATLLQCQVLGVTAWVIIAYYFYKIKFFVKV